MERFDNDQIQSDRRKQELDDLISTTNLQLKREIQILEDINNNVCLLYTSPSPRD